TVGPTGDPRIERFWELRFRPAPAATEAEGIERFREEFWGVSQRDLQADVPLFAFRWGGVDSSAVVAAMSRVMDEPVRTFTIGFSEQGIDHAPYERHVAEH